VTRKTVLQLIGSFNQGGSERQALQLTRLLGQDQRYRVCMAALDRRGVLLDEARALNPGEIAEFPLTSFHDWNFVRQVRKFSSYLEGMDVHILQTHDFYTNVFGMCAARLAGVPHRIAAKRETSGVRTKLQIRVETLAFQWANRIVANSVAVENYLQNIGVSPAKIRVIHNGVDADRFQSATVAKADIRRGLGLPLNEHLAVVTQVANLRHRVKNQEMTLRVAARLVTKFPNVHFVFAGVGERTAELRELADAMSVGDNTHFIGGCDDVAALLAASDVGVLTSRAEGFSNALLEYMLAGLPVVATDVGGASEAIVDAETGYLVAVDDDERMTEALSSILRDQSLASRMGAAGRQRASTEFSLQNQLKKTLAMYQELSDRCVA